MTRLLRVVRRTVDLPRGRYEVALRPEGLITFRKKRARRLYSLPLARVFIWAVEAYVAEQKAARRAARAARRKERGL